MKKYFTNILKYVIQHQHFSGIVIPAAPVCSPKKCITYENRIRFLIQIIEAGASNDDSIGIIRYGKSTT
ncbi:MAG: hypothetical protein U0T81_04995 [Saprospiraceae bacterium]